MAAAIQPCWISIFMAMFADAVGVETTLFLAAFAASIIGAVFLVRFFLAMFRRAAVKRYLLQRGCAPIKVLWLIIAWRVPVKPSVWVMATAFRVIYSDPNRLVHNSYCWVGYDVGIVVAPIFSGFTRHIEFVKDDIIGELPLPQGWVSDEIVTKKLQENPRTDNPPGD
jgi:hypothetical protein